MHIIDIYLQDRANYVKHRYHLSYRADAITCPVCRRTYQYKVYSSTIMWNNVEYLEDFPSQKFEDLCPECKNAGI